jgi:hypothetical protein
MLNRGVIDDPMKQQRPILHQTQHMFLPVSVQTSPYRLTPRHLFDATRPDGL